MDCNSPQSNETPSEEASSNTEWATCRLRKVLNEDCILKVLESLNVCDLLQMCYLDVYFKNLITNWIIGKKLLNIRGLQHRRSMDAIFQTFGKSMRKFIVYENDLNHFLENVITHCKPGRLTEVELNFESDGIQDLRNIHLSAPYFSNLHKLSINGPYGSYDEFLKIVILAASNLQYLELTHMDIEGDWLKTQQIMKNLRDLRIYEPNSVSVPDFTIFLQSLPKLETLIYPGRKDITDIGTTLVKYCPDLKRLEDVSISHPYRFTVESMNPYNFLASLANLNTITLTSCTFCGCDLYYPLVKLARNNFKTLRVILDLANAFTINGTERERIMQSSFDNFLSLKVLEVEILNSKLAGELRCDFIMYFASKLKNLATFTLECDRITNPNKIIELLPQIRTFSMSKMPFKHLPVEMRRIVRTLRKIRQARAIDDESNNLQLVVNHQQWRELQVYKDIDRLTDIVLDKNVKPYSWW